MEEQIEDEGQPHDKREEGKLPEKTVSITLGREFSQCRSRVGEKICECGLENYSIFILKDQHITVLY